MQVGLMAPQGWKGGPHIPVIVGGNGRRAWRPLRRRAQLRLPRADRDPGRIGEVSARCEAEGRDPATLRFSLYVRDGRDLIRCVARAAATDAPAMTQNTEPRPLPDPPTSTSTPYTMPQSDPTPKASAKYVE